MHSIFIALLHEQVRSIYLLFSSSAKRLTSLLKVLLNELKTSVAIFIVTVPNWALLSGVLAGLDGVFGQRAGGGELGESLSDAAVGRAAPTQTALVPWISRRRVCGHRSDRVRRLGQRTAWRGSGPDVAAVAHPGQRGGRRGWNWTDILVICCSSSLLSCLQNRFAQTKKYSQINITISWKSAMGNVFN